MQTTKNLVVLFIAGCMMSGHAFAEEDLSEIQSADLEAAALALVRKHGCFTCHAIDRKVIGPAWKDVASQISR